MASDRKEFTKATKLAAWQRAGGHCECGCGQKIIAGVEYDHIVEAAIGGDNSLENCRVMSARCHARKTSERRPEIDKVRRGFEKRIGARKKSKPMPFGRASALKKKLNGDVVPR